MRISLWQQKNRNFCFYHKSSPFLDCTFIFFGFIISLRLSLNGFLSFALFPGALYFCAWEIEIFCVQNVFSFFYFPFFLFTLTSIAKRKSSTSFKIASHLTLNLDIDIDFESKTQTVSFQVLRMETDHFIHWHSETRRKSFKCLLNRFFARKYCK